MMKHLCLYFAVIAMLFAAGCGKDDTETIYTISVNPSSTTVPAEGGEVVLEVKSNCDYTVSINNNWIHHTQTKTLQNSSVHLTIDPNTELHESRTGSITLSRGNVEQEVLITQDYFKDDQIIYYTTIDNEPLIPYQSTVFGAKIVANIYVDGTGKMIFDGPVTTIGNSAFQGCSTLMSITLPDGVKSIGAKAFRDCNGLFNITIPSSVMSIGDEAFWYCTSLPDITIPNSFKLIGTNVFYNCKLLTSVVFSEGITSLGNIGHMLYGCWNLTSIYCKPTTPPYIEPGASFPDNITNIYVPQESVANYKEADGWVNCAEKIVGYDF